MAIANVVKGAPRPTKLEETVTVLNAVHAFAKEHGLTVQPGTVFLPDEWRARGERYCNAALLIITYDGGDMQRACSLDGCDYKLNDAFQQMLGATGLGYFFEEGTHWYGGVYAR